jgi:hypothetical protein
MFHYPFMKAEFDIQPPYPVKLTPDKLDKLVAANEEALIETLKEIFSAPSTIATIQQLLALSKE